jgi:negative regulator of flagellin synthesis FlgM
MVDPIGTKPAAATTDRRVAPVATSVASAAPTVTPVAETAAATAATAATTLARSLAAEAPIDLDRVTRIRAAIARGTYPLVPETIADRLIALKLNWNPNDPS